MEDYSIKAIIIAVSLFITLATVSAIVMYYNSARQVADEVSKRTDIATSFDSIVNGENYEDTLTGVQVRSLINKYAGVSEVKIDIVEIGGHATNKYNNINNEYEVNDGWLVKLNDKTSLISEEKLNLINPVWRCAVNKVENNEGIILKVKLNVKE